MKPKIKILFVCFADSTHSQSWIDLLQESDINARVFAFPISFGNKYPQLPWPLATYTLYQPLKTRQVSKVFWIVPNYIFFRPLKRFIDNRLYGINRKWLRWIIHQWKPDIVHSLSFDMGANLTWEAFKSIPKKERPQWVISSWGTELNFGIENEKSKTKLRSYIQDCDWFISDCFRDLNHARSLGLPESKLPFITPIPGTGGVDINEISKFNRETKDRKIILIPKAYENPANKILPLIESLNLCEDILDGFKIYFLMASSEVRSYISRLPDRIKDKCICLPTVPKCDVMDLLGSSRVMIAPSLSDGTPNVMLEAMALGVLPIMSPIASIQEWLIDGKNGLLAHALYPEQISLAIRRALTDDELFCKAARMNRIIITQRANREIIQDEVINFYENICSTQRL